MVPNIDNFSEGQDADEDWDFDDAIGGECTNPVDVKQMLSDFQDEIRAMKR